MNKKPIGIIDLFCGTGAFAQGFLNSSDRYTLLYSNDINKWAIETVKANHPDTVVELGDIRSIDVVALHHQLKDKNIQLIIGGPPCQGFSSLRPNRSSKNEDIRNNLFLYFANFIDIFRPKFFVMENVVGLITHDKGNTLKRIEEKFSSIGYFFDWKILNAASFGVPQKRERLIMIGSKSKNSIQIISKHKKILETFGMRKLNSLLKEKHIIKPGKKLTLNLNYSVQSKIATIKGYFSMISLNNSSKFRAYIPKTKLSHPEILN